MAVLTHDVGYHCLPIEDIFPYYELRAAPMRSNPFHALGARKRIAAQLDTLMHKGIRHVVLSAFGCGRRHQDPADQIAKIYMEEIRQRIACFDVVVFAILDENYDPFHAAIVTMDKMCIPAMQTIQKDKECTAWKLQHARRKEPKRRKVWPTNANNQLKMSEVTRGPTKLPLGYPQAELRQRLRKDILAAKIAYCNGKMTVITRDFSHLQEEDKKKEELEQRQRQTRVKVLGRIRRQLPRNW